MKRKICIITLLFACCLVYGQEQYLQQANACFEKGDYDCALKNYNAYGKVGQTDVSSQIKKSEECYKLRLTADEYFSDKEYTKAGEKYRQILGRNSKDAFAKKQYDLCLAQTQAQTQTGNRTQPSVSQETGVVINGVRWATRNVDKPGTFAAKPEDPGMFYQWNSKTGWSAADPLKPSDGTSRWNPDWDGNKAARWQAANDPCPAGWRVPTKEEMESLDNAGSSWTTVNGVNGRIFGKGSTQLFLPAAGLRLYGNGQLHHPGVNGYYWSTTAYGDFSYYLSFLSGNVVPAIFNYRAHGFSVRCLAE